MTIDEAIERLTSLETRMKPRGFREVKYKWVLKRVRNGFYQTLVKIGSKKEVKL